MNTTDKVKAALLRHPEWTDTRIAKNHNTTIAVVRSLRGGTEPPVSEAPAVNVAGVRLANLRVLPRRPTDSAAKYIKRLPPGRGFTIKELAREWGRSEESIRRHAQDLGCIRYVEVSEDEWVQLVMSPETATKYPQ